MGYNRNLLILGAGGHGRTVKETAQAMNFFERIDFLDDNSKLAIGKCEDYELYVNDYSYAFVAFGNNELRMKWLDAVEVAGYTIPVIIHPTAYVSPTAVIYEGSIIEAKSVVNTGAKIERGSIISIGTLIDHDSIVGECSHINAGAIAKAACRIDRLTKVDSGIVYTGQF